MQSNLSVNGAQPNFRANVSRSFQDAAYYYYTRTAKTPECLQKFVKKVNEFQEFGHRNLTVSYKKEYKDGKLNYVLFASDPGYDSEAVVLTRKDVFRKIIDKFLHMNQYEFNMKVRGK
jgi:hypothetical protein